MIRLAARLVLHIVLSIVLTIPSMYIVASLLDSLSRDFPLLRDFLRTVYHALGEKYSIFAVGFVLFIVYMVLLNWRRYRYYAQMSEAVERIADGRFDVRVPVKQRNELRDMAANVNELVDRLKTSLEEERRAEQTKNELITSVSHDLRTPLTSVLGYLGLIEQDRYRDEVELRHYVQIAYDKSQRLNVLINDLFEYTRMRHDAVPLKQIDFHLGEMLGQLLTQYRMMLEQAGLQGELHLPRSPLQIHADPDKLVRVFENLLANAMTYGQSGKKIDVYLRKVAGDAVVEIVNYGEPIPSLDLPNIFDRFYRVDKSRTEHAGGSGLGLAIAKSIVERHGGSIAAFSDLSRTSFVVRLPLVETMNS